MAKNAFIRKGKKFQTKELSFHLKTREKQEQYEPQTDDKE